MSSGQNLKSLRKYIKKKHSHLKTLHRFKSRMSVHGQLQFMNKLCRILYISTSTFFDALVVIVGSDDDDEYAGGGCHSYNV